MQPKRLITHPESFHTDDVFATALLLKLFPDAEVVRSRDEAVIATGDIVYDVGKEFDPSQGRYDHHQEQAGKRKNGITYSSFGLLWREYGVRYCDGDEEVAALIDATLATPIDANDNGQDIFEARFDEVRPFTIDDVIGQLNALRWVTESEQDDEQFHKAVMLAGQILERARLAAQDKVLAQRYILDLYNQAEDKRILVTEKQASVSGVLNQCPELLYLISPRNNGTWGVFAVPDKSGSYMPRRAFPENWRAKTDHELSEVSGVSDALFCHVNGFIAIAKSSAGALALARQSLTN